MAANRTSGDLHYMVTELTDVIEKEPDFFGLLAILDYTLYKDR
ncbi:hypothetical protein ACUL41_04120 [Virgibacillus natechei]